MVERKKIDETITAARRIAALRNRFTPEDLLNDLSGKDVDQSDGALVRAVAALRDECIRPELKNPLVWKMRTRRQQAVRGEVETRSEGELATAVQLRSRRSHSQTVGDILGRTWGEDFGIDENTERILDWYRQPDHGSQTRAFYIKGGRGTGKSHLMDHAFSVVDNTEAPILVKLEFGNGGFEYHTAFGFFSEVSRQVADALPADHAVQMRGLRGRYMLETKNATALEQNIGEPVEFINAIASASGKTVKKYHRRVRRKLFFILDGIDALIDQGETRLDRIFHHLDLLFEAGAKDMTVLMAGRMDFPASHTNRLIGEEIKLIRLDSGDAERMLVSEEMPDKVSEEIRSAILKYSGGNPLLLKLAREATKHNSSNLSDDQHVDENGTSVEHLLTVLLSRLSDDLRIIVEYGIVLRRLDSNTIANVIAPAAGLSVAALDIEAGFEELRKMDWLFQPEGEWLRFREDVRAVILEGYHENRKVETRKVNQEAAKHFKPIDPAEALYHRLQLCRVGKSTPRIKLNEVAAFTPQMLAELPTLARNAVRQAQGRRSETRYHELLSRGVEDPKQALRDLEIALNNADLKEAALIFQAIPEEAFGSLRGMRLRMVWFWLSGQWSKARSIWVQPKYRHHRRVPKSGYYLLRRVLLEMEAEFEFEELAKRLRRSRAFRKTLEIHQATWRTGLPGGALDFALLAVCDDPLVLPERSETAVAAVSPWLGGGYGSANGLWQQYADRLSSRCGAADAKNPAGELDEQRHHNTFSRLNPYALPLRHLAAFGPSNALEKYLAEWRKSPVEDDKPPFAHLLQGSAGVVDILTGLGRTADWCGSFDYFHADTDFGLVARAAQRWQMTIGGVWNFPGEVPKGWQGRAGGDLCASLKIKGFGTGKSAVAAAWTQLERAHTPDRPRGTRKQVEDRMALHLKQAEKISVDGNGVMNAAAELQRDGVAGAIAVPLAIIAHPPKQQPEQEKPHA